MKNYLLHLESATTVCSVAISVNGIIIGVKEVNNGFKHAEFITVFIDELLKENKLVPKNLSAISLNTGPGSYTGLRIAAGVAKGLAYGLSIPVIGVNSMYVLLLSALQTNQNKKGFYIPMLDARRMEVYSAVYNQEKSILKQVKPTIINKDSFTDFLEQEICYFFGDANQKASTVITHKNACFIETPISAVYQSETAYNSLLKKDFLDAAYFEPLYLKAFGEK